MNHTIDEPRYMNPYLAGVMLGIVLFISFIVTGHGLGASGGMSRIMAALTDLFAPGHVDRNFYLAPLAGGDNAPLSGWLVWAIAGTMIGGLISGLISKRVRVEIRRGPRLSPRARLLFAFVGGGLVGFGARLARGCTSGQALSGGATLSLGSWVIMMCIFAGAYLLAYPLRRFWT